METLFGYIHENLEGRTSLDLSLQRATNGISQYNQGRVPYEVTYSEEEFQEDLKQSYDDFYLPWIMEDQKEPLTLGEYLFTGAYMEFIYDVQRHTRIHALAVRIE